MNSTPEQHAGAAASIFSAALGSPEDPGMYTRIPGFSKPGKSVSIPSSLIII
jgi:hypothetical protein